MERGAYKLLSTGTLLRGHEGMRFGAGGCPSSSPSHRKSPPMPSGDAGIESSSTWQPASSHPGAPRAAPLISSERKEEGREEEEGEGGGFTRRRRGK